MRQAVLPFLALVGFALASAADDPTPLSIELKPDRWQLLPESVQAVYIGPDGRRWNQLRTDSSSRSLADIRTALAREFRRSSPQIVGVSLALFESTGRTWFYVNDGREL